MKRTIYALPLCLMLAACGDGPSEKNSWEFSENNTTSSNTTSNNTTSNNTTSNNTTGSCLPHAPTEHRAMSMMCDDERGPGSSPDFDEDAWPCKEDADCTEGENGRCTGNGHDGWRCTYDNCFADGECSDGSVCECGGGFRSDNNVCLPGNCRTDADCGETGYCSPSFGDCGNYIGTVGYFCHTCEDECVTDADCGGEPGDFGDPYCMYDPGVGHWRCSNSHCVG